MTTKTKSALLALTLVSLLAAPLAEAARVGKGRSSGMQRSAPTQSYQQPSTPMAAPARPAAAPAQAAPQKGPGLGTALAAGAAGAAAGYMIGQAMDSSAGSSEAGSGFPWGTLAIGGLLLVGAMMFFRRRQAQTHGRLATPGGAPMHYQPPQAPAGNSQFGAIPPIGAGLGGGAAPLGATGLARLPDGTETPHFLRQAKATFLHLQSLNTPESLEEVRKYMTPELFEALRADIAGNSDVADFPSLDCQLTDAVDEGGRFVASVRFSGTVSESVGAPAEPFAETWHYVKDKGGQRWLLAGIQQD
ncbi:putative lipid-binding transport protein (Tim44 family) [Crenobacter luteus]|uniref:Tim44 domain-containing protein n=1 Tax=Crenobacter luteus TaxID=1452487 RepID=UPI001047E8DF|nr:Tim44-like domain-containing protein [Crenobacter luteus]TCP12991.1 putative lipid-binding transport protein (Tim44 family) [Crenobacter luteus]